MDYWRSCTTTVQLVNPFGTINYEILGLEIDESSDDVQEEAPKAGKQRLLLEKIAFQLRQNYELVTVDPSKPYIWRIDPHWNGRDAAELPKEVEYAEFKLKVIERRSCTIEELLESLNPELVNLRATSSPPANESQNQLTMDMRGIVAPGIPKNNTTTNNLLDSTSDDLYRAFISSYLALLRSHLCREYGIVPLNARTFAITPKYSSNIDSELTTPPISRLETVVLGVDFQLMSSFGVSVSIGIQSRPVNIGGTLELPLDDTLGSLTENSLVRIAPSGRVAEITSKDTKGGKQNETWLQIWKSQTEKWLKAQEISLPNLDSDEAWSALKIRRLQASKKGLDAETRGVGPFLSVNWPRALLFKFETYTPLSLSADTKPSEVYAWFEHDTGESNGYYRDPIEQALLWIENAEARQALLHKDSLAEKTWENLDTASKILDEEESNTSPMALDSFPASQTAAGVYPTPPDGILTQVTPSTPSQTQSRSQAVQENSNQRNDFLEDGQRPGVNKSDPELQELSFQAAEEDLFESTGITDADFSFFDEPHAAMEIDSQGNNNAEHFTETFREIPVDMNGRETESPEARREPRKSVTFDHDIRDASSLEPKDKEGDQDMLDADYAVPETHQGDSPPQSGSSPPLSPSLVKQNILPKSNALESHEKDKWDDDTTTGLNAVAFNPGVGVSDEKYLAKGRFAFKIGAPKTKLTKGWDGRIATRRSTAVKHDTVRRASLSWQNGKAATGRREIDNFNSSDSAPTERDESGNEENDTSDPSDSDSSSVKEPYKLPKTSRKAHITPAHNILREDGLGNDRQQESASKHSKVSTESLHWRLAELYRYFEPDSSHRSLLNLPVPASKSKSSFPVLQIPDMNNLLAMSQLIGDQVSRTTLDLLQRDHLVYPGISSLSTLTSTSAVIKLVREIFPGSQTMTVHELGSLGTEKLHLDAMNPPLFELDPVRIQVRKQQLPWQGLSSAITFWETLGLSPASNTKNVIAACVYPFSEGIEENIRSFLQTIGIAYQSQSLGSFTTPDFGGFEHTLASVKVQQPVTIVSIMEAYASTCIELGEKLATKEMDDNNIVVYIINPFGDPRALRDLLSCYFSLAHKYYTTSDPGYAKQVMRITPQIVPISMVASFEAPAYLDPSLAARFARETYDRCWLARDPIKPPFLPIPSYASVELAEEHRMQVDFQLNPDPAIDLLHEDFALHVAYSWSWDGLWISAAWTDKSGRFQTTASYCLAGQVVFKEVASEMWATTLEILQARKITWHLFVTSAQSMTPNEKATWQSLANAPTASKIKTYLISVDVNPHVHILPKWDAEPQQYSNATAPTQTSAASTPTPSSQAYAALSPQTAHTPATPSSSAAAGALPPLDLADADPTARLIDVTDSTAGLLLSSPRSVSPSLTQYHPARASGYLLKRSGASERDEPIALEVNVMDVLVNAAAAGEYSAALGREGESPRDVLREVLKVFGGLGVLARARGIEGVKSVRPWHVAVAMKAAEGLRVCMGL